MVKKYFFVLLLFVLTGPIFAQVFTQVKSNLHGVIDPVMSWIDVKNDHQLQAFVAGDYYVNDKHIVTSQLTLRGKTFRFVSTHSPFPALYRGDAAVADYDHDGDQDIVMTGLDTQGQPVMRLYRNDGHGRFTSVPQAFTPLTDGSIEWGDYDHDGDLDLLITGNDGKGPFTGLYQNIKNKYYPVKDNFVQLQNSDARWGDLDGDSDLDFIISGEDKDGFPDCRIYSNELNGYFMNVPVSIRSLKSCTIDLADYDHDGDLDIVMTGESMERSYTEVYENELAFDFKRILTGIPGVSSGKAIWGDFDHDGDMDLLVTGMTICYNFIARIYRNNQNPEIENGQLIHTQPIPRLSNGPYYYYVFASCFCDPSGGDHPHYHLFISNIHKEKRAYDLNYKFNERLIKVVPSWGKTDSGHRTSNAFKTYREAEASRMQVIESYKASGFEIHFLNW